MLDVHRVQQDEETDDPRPEVESRRTFLVAKDLVLHAAIAAWRILRIKGLAMRRPLSSEELAYVRDLVFRTDTTLEVSELEKTLSLLALLMDFHLERDPALRVTLKDACAQSEQFEQLGGGPRRSLTATAKKLHVKYPRVLFWMWRAWLLQKDTEAAFETDGAGLVRTTNEFFELSDEVQDERDRRVAALRDLGTVLHEVVNGLPRTADLAHAALDGIQGSPEGVVATSIILLKAEVAKLETLQRLIRAEYGFEGSHRPNKRFDKMARRDVRAFFEWKTGAWSETLLKQFAKPGKTEAKVRDSAVKAASRFEDRLVKFDALLLSVESREVAPSWFYARRVP